MGDINISHKLLKSSSNKRIVRQNKSAADYNLVILNNYFFSNHYPFQVIDYSVSTLTTTYFIEQTETSSIRLNDLTNALTSLLNDQSLVYLPSILDTKYEGIMVNNHYLSNITYKDCYDKLARKEVLPIGLDTNNDLVSLLVNDLGNTLIVGDKNTGKTTLLKSLITSLLVREQTDTHKIVIMEKKNRSELTLFSNVSYTCNDIEKSLQRLNREAQRRLNLFASQQNLTDIRKYNASQVSKGKPTLCYIDLFIDEISHDYQSLIYTLLKQGKLTGINIIITSKKYQSDFLKFLSSCLLLHISSSEEAGLPTSLSIVSKLTGCGDALFYNSHINKGEATRISLPLIKDIEIHRVLNKIAVN